MATVTGVAGTSIAAACTIENPGAVVRQNDAATALQSVCNDLATIKSGNVTLAGVKTFSSQPVFSAGILCNDNIHLAQTKSIIADGSGCTISGTWTISGTATVSANVSFAGGSVQVHEDANMESDSRLFVLGRCIPRSARVPVADTSAGKTLGVATGSGVDFAGKRFVLAVPNVGANGGSVPRVRTLKSTTVVPSEGETIEVIYRDAAMGAGSQYEIRNEAGTAIAKLVGSAVASGDVVLFAEFEFVSGAWKLGANSGSPWDGAADYGVVPGAGA